MPRGDGTGPIGNGPMGRGRGNCQVGRGMFGRCMGFGGGRRARPDSGNLTINDAPEVGSSAQMLDKQAELLQKQADAMRIRAEALRTNISPE